MTEVDRLRNKVKLEIQALLCKEKEAIPSKRLFELYNSEMGTPLPHVKLGYQHVDDFLRSIPDVVSSYTDWFNGLLYVKAVPIEVDKPMTFYPAGFEQRPVTSRRVVIKPEVKPPRKLGVIAEPSNLTPQVSKIKTPEIKLENPDSSAPKISPLATAPRVLLKNGLPVVRSPTPAPLQTSRPFMFLPDHLPKGAPNPPAPVSPLLTRRLPFQSVESVGKVSISRPPSIVKPTAVLSTRSDDFYWERLKKMVEDGGLNLGRVCINHNQMKSGRYIASIQVSQDFNTYPEDFESMTDAYEYAAKKAVEHFEKTPSWMVPA